MIMQEAVAASTTVAAMSRKKRTNIRQRQWMDALGALCCIVRREAMQLNTLTARRARATSHTQPK